MRNYWGSAPPPQAKPAEPPRSPSLRSVFVVGSATVVGVQHPLHRRSRMEPPRLRASLRSSCRWLSNSYWGSATVIGVQHPLHRQSLRSLPAHPSLRSVLPLVRRLYGHRPRPAWWVPRPPRSSACPSGGAHVIPPSGRFPTRPLGRAAQGAPGPGVVRPIANGLGRHTDNGSQRKILSNG